MLRSLFRQRLVIAVLFISLITLSQSLTMLPRTAFADKINPGVLDIGATLGGLTYGQWSAKWWQWAFSVTTFDDCTMNQSGQMWFLAGTADGTIANRNCNVPPKKNIMFPIFNSEQSVVEAKAALVQTNGKSSCTVGTTIINDINGNPITGTDYDALHRCAQAIAQHAEDPKSTLTAQIDGVQLKKLTNYRAATPPPLFPFTTVAGNPFGLCPTLGPCPLSSSAAADGFWIILDPPLSAGKHTINFSATVPFFSFTTGANYCLIVLPSNQKCP